MKSLRLLIGQCQEEGCGGKTLFVQSRDGGFVTQDCIRCKKAFHVTKNQLPVLDCDRCETRLETLTIDGNYFYKCGTCGKSWKVADVVPRWSELFPYFGVAAPGDPLYQG